MGFPLFRSQSGSDRRSHPPRAGPMDFIFATGQPRPELLAGSLTAAVLEAAL